MGGIMRTIESKTSRQYDNVMPSAKEVARGFFQARTSYTDSARVQSMMRFKLLELLVQHTDHTEFERIFEFGAGTGDFSVLLQKNLIYKEFVCNDINDHTDVLSRRLSPASCIKIFDMQTLENLPLSRQHFNLITSNATLQWLDASKILPILVRMIAPNGILLLGSFGTQNLCEVREVLGVGLAYVQLDSICGLLQKLGMEILAAYSEKIQLTFDTANDVFAHLRMSGVNAFSIANTNRPRYYLTKATLNAYQKRFEGRLTYEPLYILAQKPI